jgi:uncharacterized protein (DUF1330 family)
MAAYLLSVIAIRNRTPGLAEYMQKAAQLSAQYGGQYVIRGKPAENLEGTLFDTHVVVCSRFPSRERATEFYKSPEYAALKALRVDTGDYDIGVFDEAG